MKPCAECGYKKKHIHNTKECPMCKPCKDCSKKLMHCSCCEGE